MKQVFIDTNVILDFLADRIPFSEHASILFQLAKDNKINIHISALSINNTYYILRKVTSNNKALQLISEILEYTEVQDMSREIIRKAIKSGFKDFEDALQYHSAMEVGSIDVIITRNLKDFKKSELPVLSSETAVKLLLKNI